MSNLVHAGLQDVQERLAAAAESEDTDGSEDDVTENTASDAGEENTE